MMIRSESQDVEVSMTAPFRFVGPEILSCVHEFGYEAIPRLPEDGRRRGSDAVPAVRLRFMETKPSVGQALMLATQVACRIHRSAPTATGEVRATYGPGLGVLARVRIEEQAD
jgi:hypothetical protein